MKNLAVFSGLVMCALLISNICTVLQSEVAQASAVIGILYSDTTWTNENSPYNLTEAENLGFPAGMAFVSPEGKALIVLSANGDLHVAGRVRWSFGLPKEKGPRS